MYNIFSCILQRFCHFSRVTILENMIFFLKKVKEKRLLVLFSRMEIDCGNPFNSEKIDLLTLQFSQMEVDSGLTLATL